MFTVFRDPEGALTLRLGVRPLPVDSRYLEHKLHELRIDICAGESRPVSAAFARDVIEEALGAVGQSLLATEERKRTLLYFFEIAEDALSQGAA